MRRRQQRRAGTAVLAGVGALIGLLAATAPGTAEAASAIGTVDTKGSALNVRVGPTTDAEKVSRLPEGTRFTIVCQKVGEKIRGDVRTTNLWDRLSDGNYVTDAYVRRGRRALPNCDGPAQGAAAAAVKATGAWMMPVPAIVGSGFRSKDRPTHDGVDLAAARNTPIQAVGAGTVVLVQCNASTGNCDIDGSPAVMGCGWYVEIKHPGGVVTRYCHMVKQPSVRVGQSVDTGDVIGYVGTSGNSSGHHLHFEVHLTSGQADRTNAVDPVTFMQSKGVALH